jgi:DNA modification methylase
MLPTAENPVLILNDCALSALRKLPSGCVDALVTSPPYWGLRDYGIAPTDWPACSYVPMPGLPAIEVPAETSCLGLEKTLHAFLAHLVLIFEEGRRVLKPTGSAWVNMGDGYANDCFGTGSTNNTNCKQLTNQGTAHKLTEKERYRGIPNDLKKKDLIGQPWRVAFALQAAGWYLRQDNIWHKPNPMPESIRDRATKAHEYVFHLTKSERYYFDLDAWAEKASEGTHARLSQNVEAQIGSERAHAGSKTNGTMKAVCRKSIPQHDGKVKNNASMDTALSVMPLTRNKRSVWTVPTVAYSEAHYATYPPRLITPPILACTSAKGCCSQCGKPWERIIEKTGHVNKREAAHVPGNAKTKTDSTGWKPTMQSTDRWRPTCGCVVGFSESPECVPSIVLDPFGGSGTTAQVALEHGRRAILIERGPHNVELIHRRLAPFLAAPVLNLV